MLTPFTRRSVRYHGANSERKGKVANDAFGFGQTYTDTNRIHCYRGQGSYKGKLVDLMTLVVPKTKVSSGSLTAAWNGYSAHKSLALAPTCVPHAMGFEDDGEEMHFHYEHIPARSLSRIMFERRRKLGTFKLDEFSPIYRHWARELLASLCQLHEQVRGARKMGARGAKQGARAERGVGSRAATLRKEVPETVATSEASHKEGVVHEVGAMSQEYSQGFVASLFAASLRAEVPETEADIP